jgi:ankyrin repeat protein
VDALHLLLQRSQCALDINASIANTEDGMGSTALHVAAMCNQAHMVSLLLKMGASSDAVNAVGDTPLDVARRHRAVLAEAVLLSSG